MGVRTPGVRPACGSYARSSKLGATHLTKRSTTRAGLRYNPDRLALYDLAYHHARRAVILQRTDQSGSPLFRYRHEQPSARLWVVQRQQIVRTDPVRGYLVPEVLPVVLEAARVTTLGGERDGPFPHRHPAATHHRPERRRFEHLREVSEETVARYVGR